MQFGIKKKTVQSSLKRMSLIRSHMSKNGKDIKDLVMCLSEGKEFQRVRFASLSALRSKLS